jgi:signal transduction histidine kinase/CheY-like chemotaxis protein/AraC-like DNA-binding protein
VGNHTGLLEFDGISWRTIDVPNKTVYSMTKDENGTIYIGGYNDFGLLAPDEKGTLKYKTLRDRLNSTEMNFSEVWGTHWTKQGIYFQTLDYLFRWHNEKLKTLPARKTGGRFMASFTCGGQLYIRRNQMGLVQVKGDSCQLAPGGETFADKGIFMMAPYEPDCGKLLIGTGGSGFFIYDGTRAGPFPTEADDYIKKNWLCHGIPLSSRPGHFAAATNLGGLVIIDSRGRIIDIFTKTHGLLDNDIKYLYQDNRGMLWLALNKGISKIAYPSPFSLYNEQSNLPGLVLSIIGHGRHNDLYVGTTSGLYTLNPDGKFRQIENVPTGCFAVLSVGDSLLAATDRGVFRVNPSNNTRRMIIENISYVLSVSQQDRRRVWVGTGRGLVSLYPAPDTENGRWKVEYVNEVDREVRTIVEDGSGSLWMGTTPEGVLKIDFPRAGKITHPHVTIYDRSKGLPGGEVNVFWAANHVIFATRQGIYRIDEKTGSCIPDNTLGDAFTGGQGAGDVFRIVEDKNREIWFHSDLKNLHAAPDANTGAFTIEKTPLFRIAPASIYVIYPDLVEDAVWFGGDDGLIRYDKKIKKDYPQGFPTLIRKVWCNRNLVFGGYGAPVETDASPHRKPHPPLHIDYRNRNLRFEFAAPFFEVETDIQYRTFLEGYKEEWSGWNSEPQKEYTNLDPGRYTFRVQARNVYRRPGSEAVFRFRILRPWYSEWWAFSIYFLVLFLLLFRIVKWRSGKLEREKQKLEHTVKERTNEIEEKNEQLESQTLQLKEQAEKLEEMDKVKSRFFANISHEFRTPLTLIMGPLEQMLFDTHDHKEQKKLHLMLRNSQRLLTLINQLLELSKFESGKMKLQACRQNIIPFLKGIAASFEPVIAKNELDLTFRADREDITLYFDPGKLEEVFFNLLSNAAKFTPPGGDITITVTVNPAGEEDFPSGSLDLSVRDTGPGIPREQLAHIFDRFYQSDITFEHHTKGSGIGLAIAREIVELHQGTIDVHSSEGKGTEFIIRLPMGKEHLENHQVVDVPVIPSPRVSRAAIPAEPELTSAPGAETEIPAADRDLQLMKQEKNIILVVEDNADARDYIRGSLEPTYTVVKADDGRKGVRKAQEIIPDLIISDVMMPEIDGFELCRRLKSDVKTSHIPIVLLTARASEENILQGLETGADDYIIKPFSTRILCARIKNLIDLRRDMQLTLDREMSLQPTKMSVSTIDKKFLKKLKEVIKENIDDPDFNIEQMCKKMNMSQPTLYRKIHALTGESPTEFIRSYRLKRGAELLKNNFGTVLEVAFEVGFSSAAYFTKCFKDKFHQLPSTFQETKR